MNDLDRKIFRGIVDAFESIQKNVIEMERKEYKLIKRRYESVHKDLVELIDAFYTLRDNEQNNTTNQVH